MMILTITAVGIMLTSFALMFTSMVRFDRLLQHEHRHHPDQWDADGKPTGYFWMPEGTPLRMNPAGGRIATAWLFRKAPQWIESDEVGFRLLHAFRTIGRLAIASLLLALFVFAASQLT